MKKRVIAMLLTLVTLWLCAVPAFARSEEFISDVALVYEDSVEDALEAIKGTDWKLFEQDLNANADYWIDDGVYLIYKTSTNVEDAITDLRVMDMYGGFSISDYERQLEKSREGYLAMVADLRVAAAEFKSLYEAGDEMAKLAYRQMNYYKDVKTVGGTETDMLMGDFFLNLPTDDQIVQVLMEGNSLVITNLISLLAMGVSEGADKALATRVAENYLIKDTFTNEEYYDDAAELSRELETLSGVIHRYDALKPQYDINDENMSEEEYQFMVQYVPIALLLEKIVLGDKNLAAILRDGWTIDQLYPIVASFTKGQKALVSLGQFSTVLKYGAPSKDMEKLEAAVLEIENGLKNESGEIEAVDVYMGVDRSIFDGAFAFTSEAERQQALTGETWDMGSAADATAGIYGLVGFLGLIDLAYAGVAAGIGIKYAVMTSTLKGMVAKIATAPAWEAAVIRAKLIAIEKPYFAFCKAWLPSAKMMAGLAAGLALVLVGIAGISTWYNYYNPNYTEIPATMIDVRETDLGDKYVKYSAASVYGDEDGRLADFNAYEGKEWIALYYTKDATAGNCLTPNFKFSTDNSSVARRYQGVSMFGETNAFNLNSHVYDGDAEGAYLTVRYSNTKKAAADIPDIVGTIIGVGGYALAAGLGIGAGFGVMSIVQRNKKKKQEQTDAEA